MIPYDERKRRYDSAHFHAHISPWFTLARLCLLSLEPSDRDKNVKNISGGSFVPMETLVLLAGPETRACVELQWTPEFYFFRNYFNVLLIQRKKKTGAKNWIENYLPCMLDCMCVFASFLYHVEGLCVSTTQGRIVGIFLHNAQGKKRKKLSVLSRAAFIDPAVIYRQRDLMGLILKILFDIFFLPHQPSVCSHVQYLYVSASTEWVALCSELYFGWY